ncbi:hypothetical protein [Aureimonas sp. AU12]|uniref:hypothetical protein n=1 Tax=Aureimonas sp. AU12 TaxID=1638161 RepID=UPI000706C7D6|nr:hypothetical protein [Aureimonas sp. AU12]BAT29757.1 putative histidine kinase [Aureimonas sp. AU12]
MTDAEARDLTQDLMRDFAVLGGVHAKAAATISGSGIPEAQKTLLLHTIKTAETAIRKSGIILLSWSIGAYEGRPSLPHEEPVQH